MAEAQAPLLPAHMALANAARGVVDDYMRGFEDVMRVGETIPKPVMDVIHGLRDAVATYDKALASAQAAPLSSMLQQGLAYLDAGDILNARAYFAVTAMAIDYHPQPAEEGGVHVLISGPPGSGKTPLAEAIKGLSGAFGETWPHEITVYTTQHALVIPPGAEKS